MPVCGGGLFNRIRHPIYLCDAILYAAFALHPTTAVSLGLLAVALWALHR